MNKESDGYVMFYIEPNGFSEIAAKTRQKMSKEVKKINYNNNQQKRRWRKKRAESSNNKRAMCEQAIE